MTNEGRLKLLRAHEHRRMPWKNGGGVTTEIAVAPPDASLASFDWRVSTAEVASDGAFSLFPGIDRTLLLLEGQGMRLQVGDRSPLTLVVGGEPAIFPGDSPASASLVDGPIRDLNVMTRRGHFSHSVSVVDFAGSTSLRAAADISLLLLRHGRISLHSPHGAAELEPGDAVIDEAARAGDPLRCEGAGVLYHVSILRA
ncbi:MULTISPECIES: HutD family protein [unclassified Bradyrhizobium]|uniref:HutD/Ves family protein n=1 Tax=unclassified Bradyrhizobium TaxID=2631580 RepID=UPI001FEE5A10|nr:MULTISPECIES: HutD family protein [unclassified Bradyrhizobium]